MIIYLYIYTSHNRDILALCSAVVMIPNTPWKQQNHIHQQRHLLWTDEPWTLAVTSPCGVSSNFIPNCERLQQDDGETPQTKDTFQGFIMCNIFSRQWSCNSRETCLLKDSTFCLSVLKAALTAGPHTTEEMFRLETHERDVRNSMNQYQDIYVPQDIYLTLGRLELGWIKIHGCWMRKETETFPKKKQL